MFNIPPRFLDPASTIFPSYTNYISHSIPHYMFPWYTSILIKIFPWYTHYIPIIYLSTIYWYIYILYIYYIYIYTFIYIYRDPIYGWLRKLVTSGPVGPKDLRFILKDGAGPEAKLLAEGRIGLAEHLPWVSDPSKARPILGSWDLGMWIWGLPTTIYTLWWTNI